MIAALFVDPEGTYSRIPNIDLWGEDRDAREYRGPYPVIAHPPCQRWGKFWHGSTAKPHQYRLGEDSGCFATALTAVRNYGGVLEHQYQHGLGSYCYSRETADRTKNKDRIRLLRLQVVETIEEPKS